MNASELKSKILQSDSDSYFFTRKTMAFFGDRMSNYGARGPLTIQTYEGPVKVYELYRRRPVKHGLDSSAYFTVDTFEQRFPLKEWRDGRYVEVQA